MQKGNPSRSLRATGEGLSSAWAQGADVWLCLPPKGKAKTRLLQLLSSPLGAAHGPSCCAQK